jgi:hypothetical protein
VTEFPGCWQAHSVMASEAKPSPPLGVEIASPACAGGRLCCALPKKIGFAGCHGYAGVAVSSSRAQHAYASVGMAPKAGAGFLPDTSRASGTATRKDRVSPGVGDPAGPRSPLLIQYSHIPLFHLPIGGLWPREDGAKQDAHDKSQVQPNRPAISARKRGSKPASATFVVGVKQSQFAAWDIDANLFLEMGLGGHRAD